MIDLHVHTWRCRHAQGTADEYVAMAAASGICILAFAEHLPLAPSLAARIPGASEYAMPAAEFGQYAEDVARAAELGKGVGVEVLLGVEVDAVPDAIEFAREALTGWPLDIVLGSVHFIDDWAFDDPARRDRYREWDMRELWERYFEDLLWAARSGVADVIAHADLVKKFCGRPDGSVLGLYRQAADVIAESGCAVEVNTAGLRKPCKEIYPDIAFLRELKRAGVPVTIGSDAHRPEEVGADSGKALELLREAGYASVVVYRRRRAEEVGLDEL